MILRRIKPKTEVEEFLDLVNEKKVSYNLESIDGKEIFLAECEDKDVIKWLKDKGLHE